MNLRNARVIQRCEDLRLALKSADPIGIGYDYHRENLDGDVTGAACPRAALCPFFGTSRHPVD